MFYILILIKHIEWLILNIKRKEMILIRTPSVNRIQPFNANENHVVNFTYSGTEQIIAHNVVIERINDSEEVYNVTYYSKKYFSKWC